MDEVASSRKITVHAVIVREDGSREYLGNLLDPSPSKEEYDRPNND